MVRYATYIRTLTNNTQETGPPRAAIELRFERFDLLAVSDSLAAAAIGTLPFDVKQAMEIWITAAQSFFAIAILTNFEISMREAIALLLLFVTQVLAEFYVIRTYAEPAVTNISMSILYIYTAIYVVLGVGLFIIRRDSVIRLIKRTISNAWIALRNGASQAEHTD